MTMLVCTLAVAFVVCLLGFAVKQKLDRQKSYHVSGSNSIDVGAGYRYTEYNGKKYHYNNRVTTLLYAGLDTYDELKQTAAYGDKARADSIMLIVLDEVRRYQLLQSTVIRGQRFTVSAEMEMILALM